jgi:hypothetical protein
MYIHVTSLTMLITYPKNIKSVHRSDDDEVYESLTDIKTRDYATINLEIFGRMEGEQYFCPTRTMFALIRGL